MTCRKREMPYLKIAAANIRQYIRQGCRFAPKLAYAIESDLKEGKAMSFPEGTYPSTDTALLTRKPIDETRSRALGAAMFTAVSNNDAELPPAVQRYISESLAKSTLKKYADHWKRFAAWGGAFPATDVMGALFMAENAGITSIPAMKHQLAAISKIHRLRGHPDPTKSHLVKSTLRGIGRLHGKPIQTKKPLIKDIFFDIIGGMEMTTVRDYRDKAMLLLGFAGAFRPIELLALDVCDIEVIPGGMKCVIRRGKNDVMGKVRTVIIPNGNVWCAIKAVNDWLKLSGIESGRIFRGVRYQSNKIMPVGLSRWTLAIIVKKWIAAVGKNPDDYGGKSLRSGFVTSAFMEGFPATRIMLLTGHTNQKPLMHYCRPPDSLNKGPSYSVL
jgi:integrase